MSKVFYYDSNEFNYPTWLVELNSQELKSEYKKHFIRLFNTLSEFAPRMTHIKKEVICRIQAATIVNDSQTINSNF